jgi:predicted nucleic acid-binding protein
VVNRAALLVVRHGLRAYDAVHLASALALQHDLRGSTTLIFVTCDLRLKRAANAEKLPVADPTV